MPSESATMSEWELRLQSGARGYPVNHDQFRRFREWGLIPEPGQDGRWPAETLDWLIEIRSHPLRQLPRRVLALRGNYLHFPVPPDKIRRAVLETVPGIEAPVRKFKHVDAAMNWWAEWQNTQNRPWRSGPVIGVRALRRPTVWPPPPTEWTRILRADWVEEERVPDSNWNPWDQWADVPYREDDFIWSLRETLSEAGAANVINSYFAIDFEERIVLLMVRWLAIHEQFMRQRQAQLAAPPESSQEAKYVEPWQRVMPKPSRHRRNSRRITEAGETEDSPTTA